MTTTELLAVATATLQAGLQPLVDPASRTYWPALLLSAAWVGLAAWLPSTRQWARAQLRTLPQRLRSPSSALDLKLLLSARLLSLLRGSGGVGAAWLLATHTARLLGSQLPSPATESAPPWLLTAAYTLLLFLAWDASRFALHLLLHRVPLLWRFHQVHHSATTLTPLTYHRSHPLEAWLYQARGALVTGLIAGVAHWAAGPSLQPITLLGVPALGMVLTGLFGNLRHSQLWLPFGPLERWLISPAQHQLHHSAEPQHHDTNFGTHLAIWDRLAGTWMRAVTPPRAYGLKQPNHQQSLLSAYLGPLRGLLPGLLVALGLLLPAAAQAQSTAAESEEEPTGEPTGEPTDEPTDEPIDQAPGMHMLIHGEGGTPRVAGSAHELSEQDLRQYQYDDIERVLASQVPGVSTRGEDGYGLRPNIGIRGANSERSAKLTLMEDGVLLAPAPYAAPAAYYFPMSTRMVGIEVYKGAAATRFGPNTVGGAINLLTRPIEPGKSLRLDLAAGPRQTGRAHLIAAAGGPRAGVLIEGVGLHTAGFKHLPSAASTGFDHAEAMLKAYWSPASLRQGYSQRLSLKLGYAGEDSKETYTGLNAADYALDPYARYAATALGHMRYQRGQAELSWTLSTPSWQLRTVAYSHAMERSWTKLNGFEQGPGLYELLQSEGRSGQAAVYMAVLRGEEDSDASQSLLVGTRDRRYLASGLQTTARWRHVGGVSQELELGARLHYDQVWKLHTADSYGMSGGELVAGTAPTLIEQDSYATALALALHAHDDIRIGELHLLPGLRLETVRTQKSDTDTQGAPALRLTPLPGLALLYSTSDWVDVFLGSTRGFSPVAPGQAPQVQPETSWNHEAGVRLSQGQTGGEVVAFFNDYSNLTGQCSVSGGCVGEQVDLQYNGGQVWIWGVELGAHHELLLPGGWSVPMEASYALTQSRFRGGFASDFPQFGQVQVGDSLPYLPQHQGAARLGLRSERLSLSTGLMGRGRMLDSAGRFPGGETDVPASVLVDASLRVQVSEPVQLYVTGTNLGGSTAPTAWRPVGLRPTAPRQVMVGVDVGLR